MEYADLASSMAYHLGLTIVNACNSKPGIFKLASSEPGAKWGGCWNLCNADFPNWAAGVVLGVKRLKAGRWQQGWQTLTGGEHWNDVDHPQTVIRPGQLGTNKP